MRGFVSVQSAIPSPMWTNQGRQINQTVFFHINMSNEAYNCEYCGIVDDCYDEGSQEAHKAAPKHKSNMILANYKEEKHKYIKNKDGLLIYCIAENLDEPLMNKEKCDKQKTWIHAKPKQNVKFTFLISNDLKSDNILIVGIQLAHPQPQFQMNNHGYIFGEDTHTLKSKTSIENEVSVSFMADDIGQYEMPIMFTFHRPSNNKDIIFVREMVVMVEEVTKKLEMVKTPFKDMEQKIGKAKEFIQSTDGTPYEKSYKIPKNLKTLFPINLNEDLLEKLNLGQEMKNELRQILISARAIFDEGITEENYRMYFHHLLWWEEIIARINLRKYNMVDVKLEMAMDNTYWLEVPGLAEKRPSLLRGDRVFLRPKRNPNVLFESIIIFIKENKIQLGKLDERFADFCDPEEMFYVRFLMCRVPVERMHAAIDRVITAGQAGRIFPKPAKKLPKVQPIKKFYNTLVKENDEQRSAVEHIVSKTSDKAPYIVFGPPGTGKTMTIVEAIIQIVVKNPKHRVLVCTDSNMAADHIALMLLKYNKELKINRFILRANSENREWSIMPPELIPVSNGMSRETFRSLNNDYLSMYRIVVTTLLHSAKYGSDSSQSKCKLSMTHLFIDEAAQALEPAALVPISGLLAPTGQLVLAGDPKQLGPVCISREAANKGLGISLLERLYTTYTGMYDNDPKYITTLVQNYRSDADILKIPNELFYSEKPLQPRAKPDPLSKVSILGEPGGERAVVFHSLNSREQRMGNAPSYFNEKELAMVQRYTKALIEEHGVAHNDIGIISPYIRQVYKIRDWLTQNEYKAVEVGTVESFQGKEKRAILVSTVRANCRLLDYDAKYRLGFLVDDKRFNVALTRAKAKLIIIGNATCLVKDKKWRCYMDLCKDTDCYFGQETEQLERTARVLTEVARTRFDRCRLTEALEPALREFELKKKKIMY
ncbi:AAA domain-containing protein [Phthorimaea operculella]|nr:AAA domain-containing protein [Phthorimaea operculella]